MHRLARMDDAGHLPLPRPGYKCHPHADRGTTRRMIEVLRFVVGLAADVVRRRAGLVAENALLRQQPYMGSGEERRDREEGGAGWRGPGSDRQGYVNFGA